MNLQEFAAHDDRFVRRYAYDDETIVAADLEALDFDDDDAIVDVVAGTVIVATDDEQFELDVPITPTAAFIRNGVLTIEMEAEA